MINAKEVMVGNYLEYYYSSIILSGWHKKKISHEDIYSIACGQPHNYRGIKINKSDLVYIGFTPNKELPHIYEKGKVRVNTGNHMTVTFNGKVIGCETIHRLQNITNSINGSYE